MKLSQEALNNKSEWEKMGFELPKYNRAEIIKKTIAAPIWLHMGAGNIFRAFIANLQQNLLNSGKSDKGIIVAEGFDYEIIEKIYRPKDNLSVLVTLKSDGTIEKTVIGSIVESLKMDYGFETDWCRLKEVFTASSLQMVSFTITEKGYNLFKNDGSYFEDVEYDFKKGTVSPKSYIGKLTYLLYQRFKSGKLPIALVSMDNCSHNGIKLFNAVCDYAKSWVKNKLVSFEFLEYIKDPNFVSFPCSMIDKITPRPNDNVKNMLQNCGFDDVEAIITNKNTYVAPFVNTEQSEYLVIEDIFPNKRPELNYSGVIFTDKETVDKTEKMKVCTCLNPLHTALAIFGCLLKYKSISDEMKDKDIKKMIEMIGYNEGLPVVTNPQIINPKSFIDEVINVRLPNPFLPDTPQRIATDTSQKLAVRFGETVKAYQKSDYLKVSELKFIPIVYAGWCRYLMGIDDNGDVFKLSSDPLIDSLKYYISDIKLGDNRDFHKNLEPILSNKMIFGVDLYYVGMGITVEKIFSEMVSKKGAVRIVLNKYNNL